MNTPRRRYSFCDIIIFRKTPKGYVDITNFSFDDKYYFDTKSFYHFESDSSYLLSLWYGNRYLYAPVSIDEILLLANVKQANFINHCKGGFSNNRGDDIIAMICANKIANHKYGCIMLKRENSHQKAKWFSDTVTYEFMRKKNINGKRDYAVLFEKSFKAGGLING